MPRRAFILPLLVAGSCLVLTGCLWKPLALTPAGVPVRRPCTATVANAVRIDPAGFSAVQVSDMVAAVKALAKDSGVPLTPYVGTVAPGDRFGIVVRNGPVVDSYGGHHDGWSQPYDDDHDGLYDRGTVVLDGSTSFYQTGKRWGTWQPNFFKLAYHEFAHQLGLGDVYAPNGGETADGQSRNEIMGTHYRPYPGKGDRYGFTQVGCPPVARR